MHSRMHLAAAPDIGIALIGRRCCSEYMSCILRSRLDNEYALVE